MTDRVLIARIGAPHGVRGEVRLFAFGDDPAALRDYKLTDASGVRRFRLSSLRAAKDHFVARLAGVDDRTAAEALTNTDLYVARSDLPPAGDDDTFYHADLIGLRVEDPAGAALGTVTALYDFGAGDILEYAPATGATRLIPFTKAAVPVIDLQGRRIVVDTPPEIEAREADGDTSEG